jgi:chemotaxis response regulator CheB
MRIAIVNDVSMAVEAVRRVVLAAPGHYAAWAACNGAEGLRLPRRSHGHHTIAQDAATIAVSGMPKAAAELEAACEILALDKIAPRLSNILVSKDHG